MDKMLCWPVKWPWTVGVAVLFVLTQVLLGPWYISALFIIGVALFATSIARRLKLRLAEGGALRRHDRRPLLIPPLEMAQAVSKQPR